MLYAIMISITSCSMVSLVLPAVSAVCMCCVNCSIIPLIGAIVMTGVRRLNDDGKLCAASTAISSVETGETFAENGATMRALFIA